MAEAQASAPLDDTNLEEHGGNISAAPETVDESQSRSIGDICLIPEADLTIVLQNFKLDDLRLFVRNAMNGTGLKRLEDTPKSHSLILPDEVHVHVIESMLKAVGEGFGVILNRNGAMETLSDGTRVYRDDDDPSEAMIIALLIIFGKHKLTPHSLTLHQLSDLCIIIDKYRLHDFLEWRTDHWASQVSLEWSGADLEDYGSGLCVAHVLQHSTIFQSVTKGFLWYGRQPLTMKDKPFPERLLERLNIEGANVRGQDFVKGINGLVVKYLGDGDKTQCINAKPDCDFMAYGSLCLSLRRSELLQAMKGKSSPPSHHLVLGHSVFDGVKELRTLKIASLCAPHDSRKAREGLEIHGLMKNLTSWLEGENLDDKGAKLMKLWKEIIEQSNSRK